MRVVSVILIMLALITLSASASALSLPSQFGSLMSFPTSFTTSVPTNVFSSGLTGYSPVVNIPTTDLYSKNPDMGWVGYELNDFNTGDFSESPEAQATFAAFDAGQLAWQQGGNVM